MINLTDTFGSCEICKSRDWCVAYQGPIRDGVFPASIDDVVVAQCNFCGVQRLEENYCASIKAYETAAYRNKLKQDIHSKEHLEIQNEPIIHTLNFAWPYKLRRGVVADVGCAGGGLLDILAGSSSAQVAIEPFDLYWSLLKSRGYHVYKYSQDAVKDWKNKVDLAFSIQVIEHTDNPVQFLRDVLPLLKPDGKLIISTPNRNDILFDLIPSEFQAFFYRVVHRWYFDMNSLEKCAQLAGYRVAKILSVQRYGMANTINWLKYRAPKGHKRIDSIDEMADKFWASYLEENGKADCLYALLEKAEK